MKYSFLFYLFIITGYAYPLTLTPVLELTNRHSQPAGFTIVSEQDETIINVVSKFGIGRADITLSQGAWPKNVVVRLYLQEVEGFDVSNGTVKLELSDFIVKRSKDKRYYEVKLPKSLFIDRTTVISIQWVDFYR